MKLVERFPTSGHPNNSTSASIVTITISHPS
jgi:hypothetical protein